MERAPRGIFWPFSDFFWTPENPKRGKIVVLLNASLEEILGDKPSLLEAVLHGLVINKNPYKSLLGKKVRRAQIEAAFSCQSVFSLLR